MRICFYGASSDRIAPAFLSAAETFGRELAQRGHTLLFGGGARGLMGAVARGCASAGGSSALRPGFSIRRACSIPAALR